MTQCHIVRAVIADGPRQPAEPAKEHTRLGPIGKSVLDLTPLFITGVCGPAQLWDQPRSRGAGSFTAVSTLGVSSTNARTLKVIGSMTWGYVIDSDGRITGLGPRLATPPEQAGSIVILKRESPTWTIVR